MDDELTPISFHKLMQSRSYTAIVLATGVKKFAIYVDPQVGLYLQKYLTKEEMARPYTHSLITSIFEGFGIKIIQAVLQDVEDTTFFARLFLEQELGEKRHILEIDARPSDCITLALIHKIPFFCRKTVLEKTISFEE